MPMLKAFVAKLEDIDEGLRNLYDESEDPKGYVLSVDDLEYKQRIGEFRQRNIDLDKKRQELEEKVKQFDGVDPKKYKQATEALAKLEQMEEGKLLAEGKVDEVFNKRAGAMKTDYERQIQAKDGVIQKKDEEMGAYKTRLGSLLIDAGAQAAATKAARVRAGAMRDLLARAHEVFQIDDKGQAVPRRNGETLFGKDGNPLSMDEWASNLIAEAPHLFEESRGGGSGGGTRSESKAGGSVDRRDPTAMGKNLRAIADGKVKVVG